MLVFVSRNVKGPIRPLGPQICKKNQNRPKIGWEWLHQSSKTQGGGGYLRKSREFWKLFFLSADYIGFRSVPKNEFFEIGPKLESPGPGPWLLNWGRWLNFSACASLSTLCSAGRRYTAAGRIFATYSLMNPHYHSAAIAAPGYLPVGGLMVGMSPQRSTTTASQPSYMPYSPTRFIPIETDDEPPSAGLDICALFLSPSMSMTPPKDTLTNQCK